MKHLRILLAALLPLCAVLATAQQRTLKDAYQGVFHIGAAINSNIASGRDASAQELVSREFDSVTPENCLKWEKVHPAPGVYDFKDADQFVDYGVKHHMKVIGHVLVWHEQTPKWVFEGKDGRPATREELLERMRDHIFTVVGRYKGRIAGWDVVNEAINEDGSPRQSPWRKIIGPDFIQKAFEFAHEADPSAELHYNEYGQEKEAKLQGLLQLIGDLKAKGVKVDEVGVQGHYGLTSPTPERIDRTITALAALGVKVAFTEVDVNVLPDVAPSGSADVSLRAKRTKENDPYTQGLPEAKQKELAERYAAIFAVLLKHRDVIDRVTFWGVSDAATWLDTWPVFGRTNYPLLFDRKLQRKPAYFAVLEAVAKQK